MNEFAVADERELEVGYTTSTGIGPDSRAPAPCLHELAVAVPNPSLPWQLSAGKSHVPFPQWCRCRFRMTSRTLRMAMPHQDSRRRSRNARLGKRGALLARQKSRC